MRNERLEHAAHSYASLRRKYKDAERALTSARGDYENSKIAMDEAAKQLGQFVGANIRRKAVMMGNGLVVTLEHVSENCTPDIHVYEDGEELR